MSSGGPSGDHRRDTFSLWADEKIGINIQVMNVDTDPDGDSATPVGDPAVGITITITRESDSVDVIAAAAPTKDGTGLYSYVFTGNVSGLKGDYTAVWAFSVSGDAKQFTYYFTIGEPQPYFDSLNGDQRQLVHNVYHKVSDGFDSNKGGPYLWELPQSHFNLETVAKLMVVDAMTYINYSNPVAFIPPYSIGASPPTRAISPDWYGLVERATQYELFKHLATSYLEIPEPVGVNVAHLDRQQYFDKWMKRASIEKEELDHMLHMLKRSLRYGVKSRSMLLAGGIFPVSYLNPARPRWPYVLSRFY